MWRRVHTLSLLQFRQASAAEPAIGRSPLTAFSILCDLVDALPFAVPVACPYEQNGGMARIAS